MDQGHQTKDKEIKAEVKAETLSADDVKGKELLKDSTKDSFEEEMEKYEQEFMDPTRPLPWTATPSSSPKRRKYRCFF